MSCQQIRSKYAGAFRCIGPKCEDHCCHHWAVLIDKATYKKYESLPDVQPLLKEYLPLLAKPTDEAFAMVQLAPSGDCPFLSAERLCKIQQEHGAEYLSKTCATYPRTSNNVGGELETSLTLSCPEAARLVLLGSQLVPELDAPSTHARYGQFLLKKQISVSEHKNANEFFWALRSFSLAVITDPRYPLWQRLFILGSFCGRLGEVVAENRGGLIPQLLNDYSEIVIEKKLRAALEGIPSNPLPQLEVALKFVDRALTNLNSRSYGECRSEFLDGIQYDPDKPIPSCLPAYTEACARYYRPFMDAHASLLENYLVDYVLSRCFPVSKNGRVLELDDPKAIYFMMCIHFAVIQTMLIGMAGHFREEFGTEHVVKLVYSFTRTVEHNAKFLDDLKTYLADANLMNPSGMAILLKNPSD